MSKNGTIIHVDVVYSTPFIAAFSVAASVNFVACLGLNWGIVWYEKNVGDQYR